MQHTPRKRFGQNFLRDQSIIQQIINCINPQRAERLIEIGPGLAALTEPLIERLGHLEVVEIDRNIIQFLEQKFSPTQLTIHSADALLFDFGVDNQPVRVVGNLPYNISTPLLFHLSQYSNIQNMIFMLQKEVVARICARPHSSDYGRLSIMLQHKFKCRMLLEVPPQSFYPAPKVDSAIVSLTPHHDPELLKVDTSKLNRVVSQAFNQRRKTLANSLKGLISTQQLQAVGIDPQLRPENISVAQFAQLSNYLE